MITKLVGMLAVDLQRWDRNVSCGTGGGSSIHTLRDNVIDDFDIIEIEMENLIARPLHTWGVAFS